MRKACIFVFAAASAVALVACGGDDKKTGSDNAGEKDAGGGGDSNDDAGGAKGGGGGAANGGSGDTGLGDAGTCVDTEKVFDGTSCIPKAEGITKCRDTSEAQIPGSKNDTDMCGSGCSCKNCTQEMLDCGNNPAAGCVTILKCAVAHNCIGVGCYAADKCQAEIDGAPDGLTGFSVALATAISDCIQPLGCTAACP